ncbi:MAG: hypothetical protein ACP5JG_14470 [Anaerolineae bacterium]
MFRRTLIVSAVVLCCAVCFGLLSLGVLASPSGSPVQQVAPSAPPLDPGPDQEAAPSDDCTFGEQASGAKYMICMPDGAWNGDLLVYAHGYMAIDREIEIPPDQMVIPGPTGPISVSDLVTSMGYGFATTSYYTNGLAVLPAIADLVDLVDVFATVETTPTNVLLTGVSEGGLITTLGIERHPDIFDGGLAMCGPYGGFHEQVNHFGDFRIVFDYFFPGLMPGTPVTIPTSLMDEWSTSYFSSTILPVITHPANALSVTQLLSVTGASPYEFDPPTSTVTIEKLLWYNVFATEDAKRKLGGQPFDNTTRNYEGSFDDVALNSGVARIAADAAAVSEIEAFYQTTGYLDRPLVTLHTTGDYVVPYWHVPLYEEKVTQAGSGALYQHFRSDVHGHCTFNALEVLLAFQALEEMIPHRIYLPLMLQSTSAH